MTRARLGMLPRGVALVAACLGPTAAEAAPATPPVADEAKRAVPDYDGRGPEPTDAGDVLIWIPRALFAPAYVVSEYLVRRPLGAITTYAEMNEWPALLVDFFTFGPERQAGLVPTALIDFGLRTSAGFYFFWDDYLGPGVDLRLRAATGGAQWLRLNGVHRVWLDEASRSSRLEVRFEAERRPDHLFFGFGPEAPAAHESVYQADRLEAALGFRTRGYGTSSIESYLGVRQMRFSDQGCCVGSDTRLGTRVAEGAFPTPPGWPDGYRVVTQRLELAFDSRPPRDAPSGEGSDFVSPPGSGVRVAARGELDQSLEPSAAAKGPGTDGQSRREAPPSWASFGATLGAFVDLTGEQRVLGLSAMVDFVEPLRPNGSIPFTEQVSLGGDRPMRGFLPGRLRGRSSLVWQLEYQWPVWVWLDGVAHYAVGNVFDGQLADLSAGLLRQSFGVGLRTTTERDHPFEALVAFGTESFDRGAEVESVRLVLGTTSGF